MNPMSTKPDRLIARLALVLDAWAMCLCVGGISWCGWVPWPCRYFGHHLSVIGERRKYVMCSRKGCVAFGPIDDQALRDIARYGFALY